MSSPSLTVLVLAGGDLGNKRLGPTAPQWNHPLLLPAGSGLAIESIRDFYNQGPVQADLRVLIDRPAPPQVPVRQLSSKQLHLIKPQQTILETIQAGLANVKTPWVLINPITTLPSKPATLCAEIQISDQLLMREDWSALRYHSQDQWIFEGKFDTPSLQPSAPFTGIMTAPTELLAQLCETIPIQEKQDLLSLAKALYQKANATIRRTPWHDLGHRTTHAASRRSRLPSRAFNQVQHCCRRDVIIKRSTDHNRLSGERSYLEGLPQSLKRHFPVLLSGEDDESDAVVMEAIPFPSLAELHLHWDLGLNNWLTILNRLSLIQDEFREASTTLEGNSRWLYSDKLQTRWNVLHQSENAPEPNNCWWNRELCINGDWFPALSEQVRSLSQALEPLEANSELHLIHGDFCFNNILCDPLYTAIRLIDPRGESPRGSILPIGYGDCRYDSVKLYHSIGGSYDAIVNNLFELRHNSPSKLSIRVYAPAHQAFLNDAFLDTLDSNMFPNRTSLQLLTASLFFSMLPLHAEDPERQLSLAYQGMLMMKKAIN